MGQFIKFKFLIHLFTLFLWQGQNIFAQMHISLAPQLAYESTQSYVVDNGNDHTFRAYNRHFSKAYGINIQVDLNQNWMYSFGWNLSSPVLGYKYRDTGPNLWRMNGALSHRFSIGTQKRIGVHRFIKVNMNNRILKIGEYIFGSQRSYSERYLLLFRTKVIAGLSYDILQSIPGDLMNDNGRNISGILGLGLQFFNGRKDHLQLNLVYSYGFNEVTKLQVNYYHDNKGYLAQLGSKGSYFALQFLYPLKILTSE